MKSLYILTITLIIVGLTVLPVETQADVPPLITYQGQLVDSIGTPVTGSRMMTFSIWTEETAGSNLFAETTLVYVDDGSFSHLIGSVDTVGHPLPASMFSTTNRLFLQLEIEGEIITPRSRLTTSPYAFVSDSDSHWSLDGSVLITNGDWGLMRGDADNHMVGETGSQVNLGAACTTSSAGASVGGGEDHLAGGQYSRIGGGFDNYASDFATVAGGSGNKAYNAYASVGGGLYNNAAGQSSVVAGGDSNYAWTGATVSGGNANTAQAHSSIGGGSDNKAWQEFASIGGGSNNIAEQDYGFIGGGSDNTAGGLASGVASGLYNLAGDEESDTAAFVGSGTYNQALAGYSVVLGGDSNYIAPDARYGTISGGRCDSVLALHGTIGGGVGNTAGDDLAYFATVGGGAGNKASGYGATIGGGAEHRALWDYSTVGGGCGNTASEHSTTVGGGYYNTASGYAAAVSSGVYNTAGGEWSTVGGGRENTAGEHAATVGGGEYNTANNLNSAVGGGAFNTASGHSATVGGGYDNTASGTSSTVPGGIANSAAGRYSFAAGRYASADHDGAFVWADSTIADFASTDENQFSVRASGGVRIFTSSDLSSGALLNAGASSWSQVCDSTLKRNIREVDYQEILLRLAELPVSQWSYKAQDESIEHIGPMAQDFYRLFGLGADDKHINSLDPDGVALAAIKALYEQNRELKAEISELKDMISRLREDENR